VHDFDIVQWITGSPIATIFATRAIRGEGAYAEFDDADITRITLVTESGVQASIAGARHNALGHDVRIEVYGSKDSLSAGLTPRTPLRTLDGADSLNINQDPYTGFIDRFRDAFRAETTAFVDLLAKGPNPCPPDAALESLRAAIACERSVASAMPIHLRDVQTDE
jgi:myo-inositol 2-dehydrogenase/D-chiro-inositol 1-dehydrogenase